MSFSGWGQGGEFVYLANTGVGDVVQCFRPIHYPMPFATTFTRMIGRIADDLVSGSYIVDLLLNDTTVVATLTFTGPLAAGTELGVGFSQLWAIGDGMDVRIRTGDSVDPVTCGFTVVVS